MVEPRTCLCISQVYARDTLKCLTEAEYMHMVDGKTGSGFRVITRMLMTLASAQPAWVEEIVLDITNDVGRCVSNLSHARPWDHVGSSLCPNASMNG